MRLEIRNSTLVILACLPALLALQAQEQRPRIEEALDQIMQFELPETPLTQACAALSRQTGVEILIAPEVLDVLPYGGDTKVTATLRNVSLREGLTRFLAPLCMSYQVTDEGVTVQAHSALLRLARRGSWATFDTLRDVQQLNWAAPRDAEKFQSRVQFRVASQAPWTDLSAAIARAAPGPGDDVLTAACRPLGWTWFPQDDHVVVLSNREQVARLLRSRVSIRCSHRPLLEVLQELARKAHLRIRVEPGASAALPLQTRENFSLLAERVTATEALDQIAAATGLTYRVDENAVVFSHPGAVGPYPERPAVTSGGPMGKAPDPYVAKLVLPEQPGGVQLEILIRESELSPEALEARRKLVKDADDILRLESNRRAAND